MRHETGRPPALGMARGAEDKRNAVSGIVADDSGEARGTEASPIEIRSYTGLTDTRGQSVTLDSWGSCVGWIKDLVRQCRASRKDALPCWAPHLLAPGETRTDANVEAITLAVLDVDSLEGSFDDLCERVRRLGYAALIHESPGSTSDLLKARIVVPLDEPHAATMCGPMRYALAERLGVQVDPQTLNASRVFFVGRAEGTGFRRVEIIDGRPTSIADLGAQAEDVDAHAHADGEGRLLAGLGTATQESVASTLTALRRVWPAPGESGGERHAKGRALGGWLARRGWGDDAIASVVRELDASGATVQHRVAMALDAARRARGGLAAPGYADMRDLLGSDVLSNLENAATDPAMPDDWPTTEDPWSPWWQRAYSPGGWHDRREARRATHQKAAATEPRKVRAAGAPPTLVVTRTGGSASYFVRDYRRPEDHAEYVECGSHAVHVTLRETHAEHYVVTHTGGRNSRRRSVADITNEEALGVDRVEWDFARPGSYVLDLSGSEPRMVRGIDCPKIDPAFDADADAWLRTIAGNRQKQAALHEWIASCRQDRIHRLATAVLIVGPHGIGKSLTPTVLARTWGAPKPVDLAHCVKQFNAAMTACPIVADDECKTLARRIVSTEEFRSIVQERQRAFEPKNREQRILHGAQRFWISTNDLGAFTFSNAMGAGALDALTERLLILNVTEERAVGARAALDRLRNASGDVDLDRLLGHFAWIADSTEVPDESVRFLGADDDRAGARGALLGGVVAAHSPLFDLLRQAVQQNVETTPGVYLRPGGRIFVRPTELAVSLDESGDNADRWNDARVRGALAPLLSGPSTTIAVGRKSVRVVPLDRGRLLEALQ